MYARLNTVKYASCEPALTLYCPSAARVSGSPFLAEPVGRSSIAGFLPACIPTRQRAQIEPTTAFPRAPLAGLGSGSGRLEWRLPVAAVAAHSLHYTGAKSGPGDEEATVPRGGALVAGGAARVICLRSRPARWRIRSSMYT